MTDETNSTQSEKAKFFIYGGLAIPAEKVHPLTVAIEAIRVQYGLKPGDHLKFDTNSRPLYVSVDNYTAAKSGVISACSEYGVEFLSYMVLHKIAKQKQPILIGYGLNTIVSVFNFTFLPEREDTGIVIVDRLPFKTGYEFLKGKFSVGLIMEDGREARLNNIDLFATTCDGASHLSSAVDIVLGAFRFCVNQTGASPVSKKLFPVVARMLYHRLDGETRYVAERGVTLRPKSIQVPAYSKEYDEVVARLIALAAED